MSKYLHSDGNYYDYQETEQEKQDRLIAYHKSIHGVDVSKLNKLEHDRAYMSMKIEEGGKKFDSEKPPMDLIPHDALVEIARVLQAGELKYGTANWANGIEIRRLLAAAMRHIGQFNNGEDNDSETDTLHIANAATNLLFAIWMMKNRPDLDNRWIKGINNGKK